MYLNTHSPTLDSHVASKAPRSFRFGIQPPLVSDVWHTYHSFNLENLRAFFVSGHISGCIALERHTFITKASARVDQQEYSMLDATSKEIYVLRGRVNICSLTEGDIDVCLLNCRGRRMFLNEQSYGWIELSIAGVHTRRNRHNEHMWSSIHFANVTDGVPGGNWFTEAQDILLSVVEGANETNFNRQYPLDIVVYLLSPCTSCSNI